MAQEFLFVVLIEEGKPAVRYTYNTFEALTEDLPNLLVKPADGWRQVFIFEGTQWYVTPGDYKYLISPNLSHAPIPLFSLPKPAEISGEGFVDQLEDVSVDKAYQKATSGSSLVGNESDDPFEEVDPQPLGPNGANT